MDQQPPPPYAIAMEGPDSNPHTEEEKRGHVAGAEYSEVTGDAEAPPPSYEATNNQPPQYTDDPPPSYDSLILGKVQKVRDESSGHADFAKRMFCIACCGTTCTLIFIVISFAFPLASLVIGSIYIHDCPRERYIPIFLIVSGVFGILRGISTTIHTIINRKRTEEEQEGDETNKKANPFDGITGCFMLGWSIAGSVWVYRIYKDYQSVDPTADDYCNATCYLYAFWSLTACYILIAVTICCGCGFAGLACCAGAAQASKREVA